MREKYIRHVVSMVVLSIAATGCFLSCWAQDEVDLDYEFYKNCTDKLEMYAALGKQPDISGNTTASRAERSAILRVFNWNVFCGNYFYLLDETEVEILERYFEPSQFAEDRWQNQRKYVVLFTALFNRLKEKNYDFSWAKGPFVLEQKLSKTYEDATALRDLGKTNANPQILKLALLKYRLMEGYRDADALALETEQDLAIAEGKEKGEEARQQTLLDEQKKLAKAKTEAELAQQEAEQQKALAAEMKALAEKNKSQYEEYLRMKEQAEQETADANKGIQVAEERIKEVEDASQQEYEAGLREIRQLKDPWTQIGSVSLAVDVFQPRYGNRISLERYASAWFELTQTKNLNETKGEYIHFYMAHAFQPLGPGKCLFTASKNSDDIKVVGQCTTGRYCDFAFREGGNYRMFTKSLGVTSYKTVLGKVEQALAVEILFVE